MPQTLLALLALVMLMTFSVQQQHHAFEHQRDMIGARLEVMGNAIASQELSRMKRTSFDRRPSASKSATELSPSDFTPLPFDTTGAQICVNLDECEDGLEQFHGMQAVRGFAMDRPGAAGVDSLYFLLDTEVFYVNDDGSRASGRTMTKRVRITLNVRDDNYKAFLPGPITMSRDFSP